MWAFDFRILGKLREDEPLCFDIRLGDTVIHEVSPSELVEKMEALIAERLKKP